jgi:hypothetical protein
MGWAVLWTACQTAPEPLELASPSENPTRPWAIVIHGGAGHFGEESMSPEMQTLYTASLEAALSLGEAQLAIGMRLLIGDDPFVHRYPFVSLHKLNEIHPRRQVLTVKLDRMA